MKKSSDAFETFVNPGFDPGAKGGRGQASWPVREQASREETTASKPLTAEELAGAQWEEVDLESGEAHEHQSGEARLSEEQKRNSTSSEFWRDPDRGFSMDSTDNTRRSTASSLLRPGGALFGRPSGGSTSSTRSLPRPGTSFGAPSGGSHKVVLPTFSNSRSSRRPSLAEETEKNEDGGIIAAAAARMGAGEKKRTRVRNCLDNTCFHEKKRVRYSWRAFAALGLAYFIYCTVLIADLLQLLKCIDPETMDECIAIQEISIYNLCSTSIGLSVQASMVYPSVVEVEIKELEVEVKNNGKIISTSSMVRSCSPPPPSMHT
jgi:hypothetical protein